MVLNARDCTNYKIKIAKANDVWKQNTVLNEIESVTSYLFTDS